MTDPLTFVRDADPAADLRPSAGARHRMDAALEEVLAGAVAEAHAPQRAAGASTRRRLVFAAAIVGAVAVIGMAVLPGADVETPIAPTPASAAVVLERLGQTAARAQPRAGRWLYVRTRLFITHMRPRPGRPRDAFATVVPHDSETWTARDGSEQVIRDRQLWDEATYPTRQDEIDGTAVSPLPVPKMVGRADDVKVAGFSAAELRALPTDPAALRARLQRAKLGFKSPSPLVTATGMVLGSPLTPPGVRAAAFSVLRGLPGARALTGVRDPLGRSGDVVEFDDDAWSGRSSIGAETQDFG